MAAWYIARGYEVAARNWTCRTAEVRGEIDLVATRPGLVVICEVKTRSSSAFGGPVAAVGPDKQNRLRRLALAYLRATGVSARSLRFDVAAVIGSQVDVIEAAF